MSKEISKETFCYCLLRNKYNKSILNVQKNCRGLFIPNWGLVLYQYEKSFQPYNIHVDVITWIFFDLFHGEQYAGASDVGRSEFKNISRVNALKFIRVHLQLVRVLFPFVTNEKSLSEIVNLFCPRFSFPCPILYFHVLEHTQPLFLVTSIEFLLKMRK